MCCSFISNLSSRFLIAITNFISSGLQVNPRACWSKYWFENDVQSLDTSENFVTNSRKMFCYNDKNQARELEIINTEFIPCCFVGDFNLFNQLSDDLLLKFTIENNVRLIIAMDLKQAQKFLEERRKLLNLIKISIRSRYRFPLLRIWRKRKRTVCVLLRVYCAVKVSPNRGVVQVKYARWANVLCNFLIFLFCNIFWFFFYILHLLLT